MVSEKLAESLGQPVVVDYRPGGEGNIGAEIAALAAPDGYSLVILNTSHGTSPGLNKKLKYDPVKDFTPVSLVATTSNLIVVHPSLPVENLKELAALGHASPGKLTYGSGGVGASTHLVGELFSSSADGTRTLQGREHSNDEYHRGGNRYGGGDASSGNPIH